MRLEVVFKDTKYQYFKDANMAKVSITVVMWFMR